MAGVLVGSNAVHECPDCAGLWLDVSSFERICADREQQAAVLGGASPAPVQLASDVSSKITYVPCPECSQLMNRINFARCSGVIVDICKGHGTWFDRDELSHIVEFIRAGGLDAARSKEKTKLADERRQLRAEQLATAARGDAGCGFGEDDQRIEAIASAGGLLKILLG